MALYGGFQRLAFQPLPAYQQVIFDTVPNVVGLSQASGTTTLQNAGFTVTVQTAYSSTVAAGLIISQSPVGGMEAAEGSAVVIVVSLGEFAAYGNLILVQPETRFFVVGPDNRVIVR